MNDPTSWMCVVQLAQWRVGLGLPNLPDGGLDDAVLVVLMLGNCLFDGLNDPLPRACRVIVFKNTKF